MLTFCYNDVVQPAKKGTFDFALVDADKINYWNNHERLLKLVRIGGIIAYDNTLWGGTVALPEDQVPDQTRQGRNDTIAFNQSISDDSRVQLAFTSIGDGISFCRRIL